MIGTDTAVPCHQADHGGLHAASCHLTFILNFAFLQCDAFTWGSVAGSAQTVCSSSSLSTMSCEILAAYLRSECSAVAEIRYDAAGVQFVHQSHTGMQLTYAQPAKANNSNMLQDLDSRKVGASQARASNVKLRQSRDIDEHAHEHVWPLYCPFALVHMLANQDQLSSWLLAPHAAAAAACLAVQMSMARAISCTDDSKTAKLQHTTGARSASVDSLGLQTAAMEARCDGSNSADAPTSTERVLPVRSMPTSPGSQAASSATLVSPKNHKAQPPPSQSLLSRSNSNTSLYQFRLVTLQTPRSD